MIPIFHRKDLSKVVCVLTQNWQYSPNELISIPATFHLLNQTLMFHAAHKICLSCKCRKKGIQTFRPKHGFKTTTSTAVAATTQDQAQV